MTWRLNDNDDHDEDGDDDDDGDDDNNYDVAAGVFMKQPACCHLVEDPIIKGSENAKDKKNNNEERAKSKKTIEKGKRKLKT